MEVVIPLDLLVERMPEVLALVMRDGRVVRCSKAAGELLHAEPGTPVDRLFDSRSHRKLEDALLTAPTSCELQVRNAEAELVAVRVAIAPLEAGGHLMLIARIGEGYADAMARQLLSANAHLANLTREQARQSSELEAARRRFESLAELREHFISMLAHDVRGALHSILLNSEMIERASGSAEVVCARIEHIRRSAVRVNELVDKVLEAARTETGRMVIDTQPVSMRAVARDATEVYGAIAERGGIGLSFVDRAERDVVSGDRIRLGQVTGNLIENAIRHSPKGGTVTVELSSGPRLVRLEVRDQGPGIPPELRERIFDRFVQGAEASGSLGLGLYVARKLVELHHGRIFVDSVPHGAALVVELPAARS
ncbi:MAG: HAMP domain-containing sensor histidine kinase [Kofleriaceae bacterium]|nr:HAMP domain-containing sensor histidine kinase [Kofleriaceae bacterium]